MSYLEIKNLEISFPTPKGKYIAVKDINLSIKKGEIISIIGHSGCGKSTILNAIGGMLSPTGGSVILDNKNIKGPGPDRGIVFQNYSLLPWLTVENNIFQAVDSVMNCSKEEKHEIVIKNLKMVNLFQHKDKLPGQLSGGMKQRKNNRDDYARHRRSVVFIRPNRGFAQWTGINYPRNSYGKFTKTKKQD